eukprot:9367505-Lingulodinium_polyedra.AAC.1
MRAMADFAGIQNDTRPLLAGRSCQLTRNLRTPWPEHRYSRATARPECNKLWTTIGGYRHVRATRACAM